jgi:hypothetical protein
MGEAFRSIWQGVRDGASHSFGNPVQLLRLLDSDRSLQVVLHEPDSVYLDDVVRWHQWVSNKSATNIHDPLYGKGFWAWDPTERVYKGGGAKFAIAELTRSTEIKGWTGDIRQVTGLSNSKSNLELFTSLDTFAEQECVGLLGNGSAEKLAENLAFHGLDYLQDPSKMSFVCYLWSPRLFLINHDGSHHFAAARYLAGRLQKYIPLRGTLRVSEFDEQAVAELRHAYDLFVVDDNATFACEFHDSMAAFRAAYMFLPPPRGYGKVAVVALPRSDQRSRKVAAILREARAVDLGDHLGKLCAQQEVHRKALPLGHQERFPKRRPALGAGATF